MSQSLQPPPRDRTELPRPPDKPHPDECCHRGCCPCIFDYYWDAVERWEAIIIALGEDPKLARARFNEARSKLA